MLIILSPAKTMNMADTGRQLPETAPLFGTDARFLASKMQAYTRPELEKILHISPALADATYRQYQQFGSAGNRGKQALLAYNGSVFKAINASAFSEPYPHYIHFIRSGPPTRPNRSLSDRFLLKTERNTRQSIRLLASEINRSLNRSLPASRRNYH